MRAKVERRGIGGEDIEVRRSKHRGMGATHPTAADPPGPSVVRPTTIDSRFVSSASRGSTTPARLARPDQDAVAQGTSREKPTTGSGARPSRHGIPGAGAELQLGASSLEPRGAGGGEGDAGARRRTRARGASPKASAFRRHACNANSTTGLPRTASVIAEWHCYDASCICGLPCSERATFYPTQCGNYAVPCTCSLLAYSRDDTRRARSGLRVLAVARRTRRYP